MSVEVKEPTLNLREIERAILKHCCSLNDEDLKNELYAVRNAPIVMLHVEALAKHLLEIFNVDIGFSRAKRIQYGVQELTDWDKDRAKVSEDDPNRAKKLARIAEEENQEAAAHAAYDAQAWALVRKWTNVIQRRAYALERLGLVDCDVEGLTPQSVSIEPGFESTADQCWEGTVQITLDGLKFLASGRTLREADKQDSVDPLERDLEIVK